MWLAQEVIRQKRDGLEVSAADLQRLVRGIADDSRKTCGCNRPVPVGSVRRSLTGPDTKADLNRTSSLVSNRR